MVKVVAEIAPVVNHGRHVRWARIEQCGRLDKYKQLRDNGSTQRAAAIQAGAPRSTLEAWIISGQTLDADVEVISFFESTPGLAFLHRLVTALHTIMVEVGACGIRLVCQVLKLSGIDRFVASSFEAQRRFNVSVQQSIVAYADSERTKLAENMPSRDITVAQDETFTGGLTLVAIEPESGFILVEESATARDTVAWKAAMDKATAGLSCTIIQSTSDEAKALISYAENVLGAHHSPDLFHVQQELSRAVSAPLAAKARAAEREVERTVAEVLATDAAAKEHVEGIAMRGRGRPPDWTARALDAKLAADMARAEAERLAQVRDAMRAAVRGIGEDYHFADLMTGNRLNSSIILGRLQKHIDDVRAAATAEGLTEYSFSRIAKAERVLPKMAQTIDFVSGYVRHQVGKLGLTRKESYQLHTKLIPACYLERVATKKNRVDGAPLRETAAVLIAPLFALGGIFDGLDPEALARLQAEADRLAGVFQRSSSCVEGRNGVLSFRHHELRGLPPRKRQCLTALHNYFIKRPDGSTAAGRFFGNKPRDLFDAVLTAVTVPRRPKSPPRRLAQVG